MLGTLRLERICIAFLLVASSALAIATYGASPVRARLHRPSTRSSFNWLTSSANHGNYCVDIPGYPFPDDISTYREAQWALEAHTCKTGVPNQDLAMLDQLISLEAGKIRFTRLDVCLEVSTFTDDTGVTVREAAPMIVNPCRNIPAQQIVLADDGRVHPVIDQTKCLTVATRALEAGDRAPGQPWYRRPMTFSTCEDSASDRQVWAAATRTPNPRAPRSRAIRPVCCSIYGRSSTCPTTAWANRSRTRPSSRPPTRTWPRWTR